MISWEVLGTTVAGMGLAVSAGYNVWQGWKAKRAEQRVKMAENDAAVSRAESSEAVFKLVTAQLADVTSRLGTAEGRIDLLQEQVRARDNKIHAHEMHIRDLEAVLVQHGIPIPVRFP